jgi:endonuclease IV
LLIEISAGAGEVMGDQFEEIAEFIDKAERGKEIGVCFDTQHAFASGYDLRTKKAVDATFKAFDKTDLPEPGLAYIKSIQVVCWVEPG